MTWDTSRVDGPIEVVIRGEPDADGVRPVVGQAEGYHLNVARADLTAEASMAEVDPEPSTPARTFAGDIRGEDGRFLLTAFLRFDDQVAAIAALPDLWFDDQVVEDLVLEDEE